MKAFTNTFGITIAELKAVVKDLPETDEYGDPYEVWIGNEQGTSNVAKSIWPLNKGERGQDILIDY
jgi:hypothetical protein